MKKRRPQTGYGLFFIEFIIALFFFLLIGTICIRVFVYAHQVTQKADALSHAQALSASLAEAIEGSDGSGESLLAFFPDAVLSEDKCLLTLSFRQDFTECNQEEAFYTLTAELSPSDRRKAADITVKNRDQELIYHLSVSFYRPLTREEALS